MKTRTILFAALSSVIALASCSKDVVYEDTYNANDIVGFTVSSGKITKAPVLNNDVIGTTGYDSFGVFAYYTGQSAWASYIPSTANFMNNQEVSSDDSGATWTYSPVKYWPNTSGDKISFFAYLPHLDETTTTTPTTGVTAVDLDATSKTPKLTFTQESDPEKMIDLVVARTLDQTKSASAISLMFQHVLTRLNFSAKPSSQLINGDGTTTVYVRNLRILGTAANAVSGDQTASTSAANADSKLYDAGTFTIASGATDADAIGAWDLTASTAVANPIELSAILNTAEIGSTQSSINATTRAYTETAIAVDNTATATSLLKDKEYVFLLPPNGEDGIESTGDIRIQVEYDVVTIDNKLTGEYSITSAAAALDLPVGALKMSKAYNVLLTFSLESVVLDADTTDWDTDDTITEEEDVDASTVTATSSAQLDLIAAVESLNTVKGVNPNYNYFTIVVPGGIINLVNLEGATQLYNFEMSDRIALVVEDTATESITGTVTPPTGWEWDSATCVMTKTTDQGWYINSASADELIGVDDTTSIVFLDETLSDQGVKNLQALLSNSAASASASTAPSIATRTGDAADTSSAAVTTQSKCDNISLSMPLLNAVPAAAFTGCDKLQKLMLPVVTSLGDTCFDGIGDDLTYLSIATDPSVTLTVVGDDIFGVGNYQFYSLTLVTGSNTINASTSSNTWKVGDTTYLFNDVLNQDSETKDPAVTDATVDGSIALGQQEFADGGIITIN